MSLFYEKLDLPDDQSFRIHHAVHPHFIIPWHYHPEFEIIYIKKGFGTRFVGDSLSHFMEGDLVFLGKNLPHVWNNDGKFYDEGNTLQAHAVVLHFADAFWENAFIHLPEFNNLRGMFQDARRGIHFKGKKKKVLLRQIEKIDAMSGPAKVFSFMQLLHMMSEHSPRDLLASGGFTVSRSDTGNQRLKKVLDYIMGHYKNPIGLEEIAGIANMSATAFCRFFKQQTGKTFTRFMNEIRVGRACQLLAESEMSITVVVYECGFGNQSHFNDLFYKIKNCTPRDYRNRFKLA
jgi:AraC-like DNA-binding protein